MANADKLNDFRRDAMRLGIEVLPPSVQTSYRPFEVGDNTIFYALAAIKGVGEAAVDHIVERRGDKPFESLEDFANPHRHPHRQPPHAGRPDRRRRARLFRP
jgi:DNA polymerase-3 subunit alpha